MPLVQMPFEEALAETSNARRHILLGNGFSIEAYGQFHYQSLVDKATASDPRLHGLFKGHEAGDFERLLSALDDPEDAEYVRRKFAETISQVHPKWGMVGRQRLQGCGAFLAQFTREGQQQRLLRGQIFTTNYDVMLYWALVAHRARLRCGDGLRFEWAPVHAQNNEGSVHYLHGGMHIHHRPRIARNRTGEFRKVRADGTRMDLVDRVASEINSGNFPLFVAEGTSEEKWRRIFRNDYLNACFTRFRKACQHEDVLFTYGHSLSAVDRHLIDEIPKGRLRAVYVGVYDPTCDAERLRNLADEWVRSRAERKGAGSVPLVVKTFPTSEPRAWKEADEF